MLMKTFFYEVALFFQAMKFVACENLGVPAQRTARIKRQMVDTRKKVRLQKGYQRTAMNRKQMHK